VVVYFSFQHFSVSAFALVISAFEYVVRRLLDDEAAEYDYLADIDNIGQHATIAARQ
jgi:hypothetical protein